jgi:transcriptional regulator with XRE-family HTH domain
VPPVAMAASAVRTSQMWSVDVSTIDRARILRGWTRRELGRQARIDEGTLCDLFARRRHPTFGTLHALCRTLGLSFGAVIAFSGEKPGALADNGPH